MDTNYPGQPYTLLKMERGNLLQPSLLLDYQELGNVVYVRGPGNDDNEEVFIQRADRDDNSPYNRVEWVINADRSNEDESSIVLLTEAENALDERRPKIEFTFPVEDLPGFQYRVDYFVGDLVSAEWGSFRSDLRVTGVQGSVQDGNETLKVTVKRESLQSL